MEAIVGIILFFFAGLIIKSLIAGGKSVVTGKSFQESYSGIPDWSMKIESEEFEGKNNNTLEFESIKSKGLIPI